jgi:CRP/FNR family transcriptional regulator, cyclic AMP receptor protein
MQQGSMEQKSSFLGCLNAEGWLSQQPSDFQARMAAAGRWVSIPRGQPIFIAGDEPAALFGLERGLLDVALPIGAGEEAISLRIGPGSWLGDASVLAGILHSTSAWAAIDSRLFRISISSIIAELDQHAESTKYFFKLAAINAAFAMSELAEVLTLPPRARFARLLLRLAAADGTVRITQEELGRITGMSRAAFRRSFAGLLQADAVRTEYGGIRILNRTKLSDAAQWEPRRIEWVPPGLGVRGAA